MMDWKKINISGKKVKIVPFTEKHLHSPEYLRWLHDCETIKFLNLPEYHTPVPFEKVEQYIKNMIESKNNLFCALHTIEDNKFIGTFKIGPIDWHAKNVNLGIMIGDKESWGKGIATEAFLFAIKFCFEELEMHKITGGCMEPNIGMCKVFEKLGFKEEGRFREQDFLEGKYSDHLHYGLLKEEYE